MADPRVVAHFTAAEECVRSQGVELETRDSLLADLDALVTPIINRITYTAGSPEPVLSPQDQELLEQIQQRERTTAVALHDCALAGTELRAFLETIRSDLANELLVRIGDEFDEQFGS